MPVYEYRCADCRRKTAVFTRTMGDPESLACSHCGSGLMQRAVSSFAYHRSMQRVWETSEAPSAMGNSDDYYRDPRNIGRHTEERLEQLGIDMPSEAQEMIDAAREGTMPAPLDDL